MQYAPPNEDEARRILAASAHRYPEKASITIGGVRLPLIIGNPTGATRAKTAAASPAWNDAIAVTLKLKSPDDAQADQLGADCVIWPDPATFDEWCERWPALPGRVAQLARQKFGGDLGCVSEPAYDERAPEDVAVAMVEQAGAVHRIVRLPSARLDVVMVTPPRVAYDAFVDAIRKPGADVWRLCCEMVSASVARALVDGKRIECDAMLDRWCGLGVVLVAVAAQLAGAGAEARLGEW